LASSALQLTVSIVVVECCNEADVPVTVMVYVPGGVPPPPPPPPLFDPPPHATAKTNPTSTKPNATMGILFFLSLSAPKPAHITPISGSQSAYSGPEIGGNVLAVAPVVLTVRVATVPGVIDAGLIEHFGASGGDGLTEQVRATEPPNAANGLTFRLEVDDAPGFTKAGESPAADTEKSGAIPKIAPRFEAPPAVVVP